MKEDLNVPRLKALRKVSVHLSNNSQEAAAKLNQLYKEGRVFAQESCEVRRDADVYLAACALADALGHDLAAHIGSVASGGGCQASCRLNGLNYAACLSVG